MIDAICLGNITIDCDDEQRLCEFYHKLLGWKMLRLFGHPALRSEHGFVFLFVQEKGYCPPVWPEQNRTQQKQMHFDFQVADVNAAEAHAAQLGAVKPKAQFGGDEFVTMIDPAGHPFCLCSKENKG